MVLDMYFFWDGTIKLWNKHNRTIFQNKNVLFSTYFLFNTLDIGF